MSSRSHKSLLLLVTVLLLVGVSLVQNSMNRDREDLGLTRVQPLDNAPPVLAFTTVALGGFRGLISNMLWMRATQLQDEDKYFEMAQLADWITKLEPHFVQVWAFEGWNMAYNISVKFKDYPDRWRWVQRGIELLRDEGLRYNPNAVMLYRELAWYFQHKLGANLDDANMYYKQQWANAMAEVFAKKTPNLDELIHPKTPDEQRRADLLRDRYKMDPRIMKEVDEKYGPLEWRLPEASAIYWAYLGLKYAEANPSRTKQDDLINLRRVIYQSLLTDLYRGRMEVNAVEKVFDLGPNLDIIPKLNEAYEQALKDDPENHVQIEDAQRNALRDAVYFLYVNNRVAEASKWFKYLGEKFPDKPILEDDPKSFPRTLTLDQYAVGCVQTDINETSRDRVKSAVEGLLLNSYRCLALDEDDRAAGYSRLAQKVRDAYLSKIPSDRWQAIGLPPIKEIAQEVLNRVLDPKRGAPPEIRARLRTKLALPAEGPVGNSSSTNSTPAVSNSIQ